MRASIPCGGLALILTLACITPFTQGLALKDSALASPDPSLRARRSVRYSHPMLRGGGRISYFRDPESEDDYFSRHGIAPRIHVRRTLPFQLVPQPPLAYAHARNFVDESQSRVRPRQLSSEEEEEEAGSLEPHPISDSKGVEEAEDVEDIISLLDKITSRLDENKQRVRFGFF